MTQEAAQGTRVVLSNDDLLRVAVIGCGYWGPNLVRNFFDAPASIVSHICDQDISRLATIGKRYPTAQLVRDYREVLADPSVDAVCIATNASSHYVIAKAALSAGKHVWVEKPLTLNHAEAVELAELAQRLGLTLMVDHTFVYTPEIQRIHESIQSQSLGDLLYYDSVRVNLGLYSHDTNVLWDLGVHDFSITDHLLPYKPVAVSAYGACHVAAGTSESIAYVTLHFQENFIAHFHLNWLAPAKIRLTTVCGSDRMVVFDDTLSSEKLRIYDRGITLNCADENEDERTMLLVDYRSGDMLAPKLASTEALQAGAQHFAACIASGTSPITDGYSGARVVAMLEAAQRSLANEGQKELIQW